MNTLTLLIYGYYSISLSFVAGYLFAWSYNELRKGRRAL